MDIRKSLAAVLCGALLAPGLMAQDAKTVLADAAKAMGLENLGSVRYTGTGYNFALGQAVNPGSPWPKFNVKTFERVIDFDAGGASQVMVRTQAENPPRGGGQQPIVGEQVQTQTINFKQPWNTTFEIWITPAGFIKSAMTHNATVERVVALGRPRQTMVSFTVDSKYKVNGYLDEQNLLTKVETRVENPVLGDMPVEAAYSDYRTFHGMKFPAKIVETQGGYPVMDLTISDANRNVVTDVQPPKIEPASNPIFGIDETLLAEDVYYFTGGTHHSVIAGFNDYVVVIEGPLDETRSGAVISEVKKLFFNKPIRYLVNTHAHFDHAGGIRTYAAEGATILTYQMNKPYYEKTFALPRTLAPDALSKSKKRAVIEAVGEKRVLTDGTHTIELYHVPNNHNEGMLIAYLPKDRMVIEADLYTPGAVGAPPPNPPSVYTVALLDWLDKMKIDYEKVVGLHGRMATKDELLRAAGRAPAEAKDATKAAAK